MTRSFSFVGALAALLCVLLALSFGRAPLPDAGWRTTAMQPAPVLTQPPAVESAIDDLAAWPAAASR